MRIFIAISFLAISVLVTGCQGKEEAIKEYSVDFERHTYEQGEILTEIFFIIGTLQDPASVSDAETADSLRRLASNIRQLGKSFQAQEAFMRKTAVPGACVRYHYAYQGYLRKAQASSQQAKRLAEMSIVRGSLYPGLIETLETLFDGPEAPNPSSPPDVCPNLSGYW